ncbi:hypothetical protein CEP52_007862 [Fusarium oligoseptatum]|uniref:Ankyrin n=1 Tax=Fusarium oligoseptatum TaxID=2604345 RepID=A0A428TKT2_9HYPO|nr:hypothetical protein CEP52_007862 [Fusarium oligoseptatum]
MEFEWPSSLPWQKFQNEFQISAGEFAQFDSARGILTTVLAQTKNHAFAQLQDLNSHSSISRLAADIGMVMPDGNREDLLYTIQDMQHNCTTGSVFHCLKIIIYHFSNNLLEFDTYETWSLFVNGLINIGILGPRMNLRDLRDKYATIKAFVEKLFQQAIRWTCEETETQEQNLALIKWLLSSGQDPNPAFWVPDLDAATTPLREAAAIGFHELVKLLLAYGATDEYADHDDKPAAVLALNSTVSDDIKLRIVDAIFKRGSLASWETVLHEAIQQGNMNLVKDILGRGPDVTKAFTDNTSPVFEMNALSFAVLAGKDFVEVIWDHARAQGNLNAHLITPDIFIAAAIAGDAETIRRLHQIHPVGSCENQRRITPLRAAVSAGQRSTCEVLLDLYGGLSPVLLFLAAYNCHEDLLRFLLEKGIDMNAAIDWDNCGECAWVSKRQVHRSKAGQFPTALCILKSSSTALSQSCSNCIAMLIEGGARLVGGEVYLFAEQWLARPLQVALARGGNPDEQGPSGKSALQAALTGDCEGRSFDFNPERSKVVQLLLKSGAKLSGGEVVWAARCRDVLLFTVLVSLRQSFQDTDDSGTSSLEAAIASRDLDLLKQVLPSYVSHYDPGTLCAAVRERHPNLIDSLLTNRPRLAAYDVLEGTAVGLAAMFGDINLLRKLLNRFHAVWEPNSAFLPPLEDWERHNSLFLALLYICFTGTMQDKSPFLCGLLHGSSRIQHTSGPRRLDGLFLSDAGKKPPLCIAIERKNSQMVQSLLDAGANVNQYDDTLELGRSPLQLAVELGDLDLVNSLKKRGADINAPPSFDGGATALQLAAMKGYIGLARLLLDWGARVNARGAMRNGRTALEGAAEHARADMLQLLIDRGALTTGYGRCQFIRAVKLATLQGHHTVAELLRQSCEWTEEDEDLFMNGDLLDSYGNYENDCSCDDIGCIHDLSESEDMESEGAYTESEETCGTGSDMED